MRAVTNGEEHHFADKRLTLFIYLNQSRCRLRYNRANRPHSLSREVRIGKIPLRSISRERMNKKQRFRGHMTAEQYEQIKRQLNENR
jgi:hypothetical protein